MTDLLHADAHELEEAEALGWRVRHCWRHEDEGNCCDRHRWLTDLFAAYRIAKDNQC